MSANFENATKAAKNLGVTRQRLFSYTSGKALPRAPMFDLMLERWGLNLLGEKQRPSGVRSKRVPTEEWGSIQPSLFDSPLIFKSEELKVVIKRKGPRLVASVEISADVEIA